MARPLKWADPAELEKAIEAYFDAAEIITWTGLALHLGFVDRGSLNDYAKKDEFSHPLKKALLRVEQEYEQRLHGNSPTGAIFALKNFNWKDRQEVEQKTTIQDNRIDESKLTDEDLRVLADIQRKSGISPETL